MLKLNSKLSVSEFSKTVFCRALVRVRNFCNTFEHLGCLSLIENMISH